MTETWKDIPGYEGHYQVSDMGGVRSLDRVVKFAAYTLASGVHRSESTRTMKGRLLRPGPSPLGHQSVVLGRGNTRQVHQLVLEAFEGPNPARLDVAHNDGDPKNNKLGNLRYATRSSNGQDFIHHGKTQLSVAQVKRIRAVADFLPYGGKSALAKELGIAPGSISDVLAGRKHAHV